MSLALRRFPALLALLIAAALLSSALLRHVEVGSHDVLHGPETTYVADCDRAPATHMDATRAVEQPTCLACLSQLAGRGDANPLPLLPTRLSRLALLESRNDIAPRSAPIRFDSARAPPPPQTA